VIRIGQRTQKERIDSAENRRSAADSQSQRQDCDQRKSRSLSHSASGVAQVLAKGFDPTRYGPEAEHVRCNSLPSRYFVLRWPLFFQAR
jgi:hypothetical protein